MDKWKVFADKAIKGSGLISQQFLDLGIYSFIEACRYVHQLPYGYNSNRDDLMILFIEQMGSCTTKHAVIATLARELGLSIEKSIGIYAMTESIVSGTQKIIAKYDLPYIPMVHCFLVSGPHRVDLTEGNHNGKNQSIEEFLHTQIVEPNISSKKEYLIYRKVINELLETQLEFRHVEIKRVLHAREDALVLLKSKTN